MTTKKTDMEKYTKKRSKIHPDYYNLYIGFLKIAQLPEPMCDEILNACNHFPAMKELLERTFEDLDDAKRIMDIEFPIQDEIESLLKEVNDVKGK